MTEEDEMMEEDELSTWTGSLEELSAIEDARAFYGEKEKERKDEILWSVLGSSFQVPLEDSSRG